MNIRSRLEWIDIAKGIGIILVVYGHIFNNLISAFIFISHMPLFFFIGGYLISNTPQNGYLANKARQLLIPYISYLIIISTIKIISLYFHHSLSSSELIKIARNSLVGGKALTEMLGVFWFVTCFFAAQQAFKTIIKKNSLLRILLYAAGFLTIGLALPLISQNFWLPLNINVVPVAIFFFATGYFYKKYFHPVIEQNTATTLLICSSLLCGMTYYFGAQQLTMNMKYANYGIPIASEIGALMAILSVICISLIFQGKPIIAKMLSVFGASSMTIMFLHQTVHISLEKTLDSGIIFLLACATPIALHFIFKKNQTSSKFFLGE